jgi:hypothetical protein
LNDTNGLILKSLAVGKYKILKQERLNEDRFN